MTLGHSGLRVVTSRCEYLAECRLCIKLPRERPCIVIRTMTLVGGVNERIKKIDIHNQKVNINNRYRGEVLLFAGERITFVVIHGSYYKI